MDDSIGHKPSGSRARARRVVIAFALPLNLLALYAAYRHFNMYERLKSFAPRLWPASGLLLLLVGPLILAAAALFGAERERLWRSALGLERPLFGLGLGALCVAPMVLGLAVGHGSPRLLSGWEILESALLPGVIEELFFRGIAYRQLRAAGWAFWPATLATGMLFGASHWGYGSAMVIIITGLGGVWYAWLLERWGNLALVMTLHASMDLAWCVFSGGENAIGDLWGNVGRGATIALSVLLTLRFRRSDRVGRADRTGDLPRL